MNAILPPWMLCRKLTARVFLPVEFEAPTSLDPPSASTGRIEIELSSGHRITAEGAFDIDVLARLLKRLAS